MADDVFPLNQSGAEIQRLLNLIDSREELMAYFAGLKTTDTDPSQLMGNGWYFIQQNHIVDPALINSGGGFIFNARGDFSDYTMVQLFVPLDVTKGIKYRTRTATGTWSSWTDILNTTDTNFSISGVAADAAAVGDKVPQVDKNGAYDYSGSGTHQVLTDANNAPINKIILIQNIISETNQAIDHIPTVDGVSNQIGYLFTYHPSSRDTRWICQVYLNMADIVHTKIFYRYIGSTDNSWSNWVAFENSNAGIQIDSDHMYGVEIIPGTTNNAVLTDADDAEINKILRIQNNSGMPSTIANLPDSDETGANQTGLLLTVSLSPNAFTIQIYTKTVTNEIFIRQKAFNVGWSSWRSLDTCSLAYDLTHIYGLEIIPGTANNAILTDADLAPVNQLIKLQNNASTMGGTISHLPDSNSASNQTGMLITINPSTRTDAWLLQIYAKTKTNEIFVRQKPFSLPWSDWKELGSSESGGGDSFDEIQACKDCLNPNLKFFSVGNSIMTGSIDYGSSPSVTYDHRPYNYVRKKLGITQANSKHTAIYATGLVSKVLASAHEDWPAYKWIGESASEVTVHQAPMSFLEYIKSCRSELADYDVLFTMLYLADMGGYGSNVTTPDVGDPANATIGDGTLLGGVLDLVNEINTYNPHLRLIIMGVPPVSKYAETRGENVFTANQGYTGESYRGDQISIGELDTIMLDLADTYHFKYISFKDWNMSTHWYEYTGRTVEGVREYNVHANTPRAYRWMGEYLAEHV